MEINEVTKLIFKKYDDAIALYHSDVLRFQLYPMLDLKTPACNLKDDLVMQAPPQIPYILVEVRLREFTDGKGNYWYQYVRN